MSISFLRGTGGPHRAVCRRLASSTLLVAIWTVVLCAAVATPYSVAAATRQPQREQVADRATHGPEGAEAGAREGEHGSGLRDIIARLVNFGILAGVLVYLLRAPLAIHLRDRGEQIRKDLAEARAIQAAAARQLEEIDRRLKALPAEIEALRVRGAEEIAGEEARIRQLAEDERQRLLEQARREVDLQLRVARRDLVRLAAELAIRVASGRISSTMTAEDQVRLVDRYLEQIH